MQFAGGHQCGVLLVDGVDDRLMIATHDEAAMAERTTAHLQGVGGIGQGRVRVRGEPVPEVVRHGVQAGAALRAQQQELFATRRACGLLHRWFGEDHVGVGTPHTETADTGDAR